MSETPKPLLHREVTVLQVASTLAGLIGILITLIAAVATQWLMVQKHDWWISQHQIWTVDRNKILDDEISSTHSSVSTISERLTRMEAKQDEIMRRVK